MVDDHPVVRDGYRRLLEHSQDIKVVAEAESGEQGCQEYFKHHPNVVVMDLSMAGMGGMEAIRRILRKDPDAKILVFSVHENDVLLSRAIKAGVRGYLTKRSAPQVMVEAVLKIAQGNMFFDPELVPRIVLQPQNSDPLRVLTPREFEVFRLLAQGHTVAQIANILCISPKTVGVHHTRIMHKLGITNLAALTLHAVRHELIDV